MAIYEFPPIESADEDGFLAIGGDLEISSLLLAYSQGIFPWPISDETPIAWFSPDPRGVLFYDQMKMTSSFTKFLKKTNYSFKFNLNFEEVIKRCASLKNRKDQAATWITDEIISAYTNLFHHGFAYSAETYENDILIGGLYGVCIGSFISGESMFFEKTNASKFALYSLMNYLKQKEINWLDTQMVTSVVEQFGGVSIKRRDYISLLNQSLNKKPKEKVFP